MSTILRPGTPLTLVTHPSAKATSFLLRLGVSDSWRKAVGPLMHVAVSLRIEGTWREWAQFRLDGGPVRNKSNPDLDVWALKATEWPSEHDGSSNPHGRKILRPHSVRVVIHVMQPVELTETTLVAD